MSRFEKIYDMIKEGESETLDFKQYVPNPHKIARTLVAFANHKGGMLVIGISDFGEITGINPQEEKYLLQKAALKFCVPPVPLTFETVKQKGDTILVAHIAKSEKSVHRAIEEDGRAAIYYRVGDKSVQEKSFQSYSHQVFDDTPILIFSDKETGLINYLKKNYTITIKQYMDLMNLSYSRAVESLNHLTENGILYHHKGGVEPHYSLR